MILVCYHVLLKLLPGCFREAACRLGGRQLALRPPQPLQELLQLAMETLSLQGKRRVKYKLIMLVYTFRYHEQKNAIFTRHVVGQIHS